MQRFGAAWDSLSAKHVLQSNMPMELTQVTTKHQKTIDRYKNAIFFRFPVSLSR